MEWIGLEPLPNVVFPFEIGIHSNHFTLTFDIRCEYLAGMSRPARDCSVTVSDPEGLSCHNHWSPPDVFTHFFICRGQPIPFEFHIVGRRLQTMPILVLSCCKRLNSSIFYLTLLRNLTSEFQAAAHLWVFQAMQPKEV